MPDTLVITPIAPRDTLALRHALLRPHLTPDTCNYPGDDAPDTVHLGACVGDDRVGIVSLYRESLPGSKVRHGYRFRALAVVEALRGKGYGRALLAAVEREAQARGAAYLWANARVAAIDFYRRAGYAVGDEEFIVAGVGPHRVVWREFGDGAF